VRARSVLADHPGFAHHFLVTWFELPAGLELTESLLAVAEDAGRTGFEAVATANAVLTFVLMRVQLEESIRAASVSTRHLALPRTAGPALPRLRANIDQYTTARSDDHFTWGLDHLLRGILGRAPARR
jgi:hypothetical protein